MRRPSKRIPVIAALVFAAASVPGQSLAAATAQSSVNQPAAGAVPGAPALPAGIPSWTAYFAIQQQLDKGADSVEAAVNANTNSGFTSDSIDQASKTLTLFWHGTPDRAEQRAIDAVRRQGLKVVIRQAQYTRTQLDAEVAQIQQDASATGGDRVLSITKKNDGSGILVAVSSRRGAAAVTAQQDAAVSQIGKDLPHLQAAAGQVAVTVFSTPDVGGSDLAREDDTSPYYGGDLIEGPSDNCTSGFSVYWPHDGYNYITTAGHCGGVGTTWKNGVGQPIGVATPGDAGYDLEFIRVPSGESAAGEIYTGPGAFKSGQGTMIVTSVSDTHVGDSLCTGGSYSGWHCFIRASGPTQDCRTDNNPCWTVEGGISTVANQCIAAHGDSGGPVWSPVNGFDQVNSTADARGLISSIPIGWSSTTPCGTDPFGNAQTGTTAVWFTPILPAIAPWAASGMYVETD